MRSTINTEYNYIDINPTPIQGVHPDLSDKPRQPKYRLTGITYLNKGYNAKKTTTKKQTQLEEQYLKVHKETDNPSLAVIIKRNKPIQT